MKTKRMHRLLLALLLVSAMALTGCSSSPANNEGAGSSAGTYQLTGQLTAQEVMLNLTAENILRSEIVTLSQEELLEALKEAAGSVKREGDIPYDTNDCWWSATIYLKASTPGEDATLFLNSGKTEDLVTVWYRCGEEEHRVQVEGSTLYEAIKNCFPGEKDVDEDALRRCSPMLEPAMAERLQQLQEIDKSSSAQANYTGYEMVKFREKAVYTDLIPGKTVSVFEMDCGFLMEHPENMLWASGTYMDNQLRLRGYDPNRYFAISEDEGGTIYLAFFDESLYTGTDGQFSEQHGRDVLQETLTAS